MLVGGIFFFLSGRTGWKWAILLAAAAPLGEILGFSLHIIKNGFALGGMNAAIEDMLVAYLGRAGISGHNATTYSLVKHIGKFGLGLQWFFTWPMIALASWGWLGCTKDASSAGSKREFSKSVCRGLFATTLLGVFIWPIVMKQHSMAHAFTYRHADVFVVLGTAFYCSQISFYRFAPRVVSLVLCLVMLVVHTGLGVFQVEGIGVRRTLIHTFVPDRDERKAWACAQLEPLFQSRELKGSKSLLLEFLSTDSVDAARQNCSEGSGSRSQSVADSVAAFPALLSQVVLYWR
jgi:hypothetical protein